MIVVCKKYRLIEISSGKYKINEHRKELRKSMKIDKLDIEEYNKIAEKTGIYYEIDEQATKDRNELLNPKPKGRPKKES